MRGALKGLVDAWKVPGRCLVSAWLAIFLLVCLARWFVGWLPVGVVGWEVGRLDPCTRFSAERSGRSGPKTVRVRRQQAFLLVSAPVSTLGQKQYCRAQRCTGCGMCFALHTPTHQLTAAYDQHLLLCFFARIFARGRANGSRAAGRMREGNAGRRSRGAQLHAHPHLVLGVFQASRRPSAQPVFLFGVSPQGMECVVLGCACFCTTAINFVISPDVVFRLTSDSILPTSSYTTAPGIRNRYQRLL